MPRKWAVRARYSEKTTNCAASENMSEPDIQIRIAELKAERNKKVDIDVAYEVRRLLEINLMDILDIMIDDMSIKPVSEWHVSWGVT